MRRKTGWGRWLGLATGLVAAMVPLLAAAQSAELARAAQTLAAYTTRARNLGVPIAEVIGAERAALLQNADVGELIRRTMTSDSSPEIVALLAGNPDIAPALTELMRERALLTPLEATAPGRRMALGCETTDAALAGLSSATLIARGPRVPLTPTLGEHDIPALVSSLDAALSKGAVGSAPTQLLSEVIPEGDPRLTPTLEREGREDLRGQIVSQLFSESAAGGEPVSFWIAGGMGVRKGAALQALESAGVVPDGLVRLDADYVHTLIPELSEFLEIGDGRGFDVVHEESSEIVRATLEKVLQHRSPFVYNSMLSTPESVQRVRMVKEQGYPVVIVAVTSTPERAMATVGADGRDVPVDYLKGSLQRFSQNFDELRQLADVMVLLDSNGPVTRTIAVTTQGNLKVLDQAAFGEFQSLGATP